MMELTGDAEAVWKNYVLEKYPNEACAFVVNGTIYPVPNLAANPGKQFKVDVVERLKLSAIGEVQAFLHSHPYELKDSPFAWDPAWASTMDMVAWIADNIPWGITATDGEGCSPTLWYDDSFERIAPLENREFISGKWDCYSIVRDYYRKELGILLPNFARGMGWWDEGKNLYLDNFKRVGFYEIPMSDVRVNDLLLMKLGNDVVSHAAVVVDTNKILHHCIRRLSGYDTVAKWHRQVAMAIRYSGSDTNAE